MPAPRPYDASSRRESAARNRAAVLAACRELLFRDGYHRMTVRSVAGQAGVSPETVYKAFGGKAGLMKALWDVTLAGDDQPVAIADRPQMQEVRSAADPAEKLRRWGWVGRRATAGSPKPAPRSPRCSPRPSRNGRPASAPSAPTWPPRACSRPGATRQ